MACGFGRNSAHGLCQVMHHGQNPAKMANQPKLLKLGELEGELHSELSPTALEELLKGKRISQKDQVHVFRMRTKAKITSLMHNDSERAVYLNRCAELRAALQGRSLAEGQDAAPGGEKATMRRKTEAALDALLGKSQSSIQLFDGRPPQQSPTAAEGMWVPVFPGQQRRLDRPPEVPPIS